MAKVRIRKDIAEQITGKLKTLKKGLESANSVQNVTNFDNTSKLQANKNVFSRGDFEEYKISDEELKNHTSRHYFSESELRKKGKFQK